MKQKILTKTSEETQAIAKDFATKLQGGDIVLLYGKLGAGKTTFTQGIAKGLGITQRIISPTFIIVRSYILGKGNFYHVDLYRLESEKEIENVGLLEKMQDKESITIVEWSEKLGSLKPKKRWEIHLQAKGENEREITIENF